MEFVQTTNNRTMITDNFVTTVEGNTGLIPSDDVSNGFTGVRPRTQYDFKIYPNRFENSFSIQLSENITYPLKIEVLDYLGKVVYKETLKADETVITLNNQLSTGTYFVKITSQSTHKIIRIVKL